MTGEDGDYIQPENETSDWLIYAEYILWQLGQSRESGEIAQTGQSLT